MNPREVAIRICLRLMPNAIITVDGEEVDWRDYIESDKTITFSCRAAL